MKDGRWMIDEWEMDEWNMIGWRKADGRTDDEQLLDEGLMLSIGRKYNRGRWSEDMLTICEGWIFKNG